MDTFLQVAANGLMLGGLFALVSVGLTLIFGIVKVVNFAHGEFLMAGMYLTFVATRAFGLHPFAAVILVVPALFVLGAVTQRYLIQPLMGGEAAMQIFATVGLSTAMINLALLVFGADLATTPASGMRAPVQLGPVRVLAGQAAVFAASVALVVALQAFLSRTQTGRAIRAVAQNRAAAELMGINVGGIFALTFGIGAACVGVASVLIAPLYPTSPTIGTYFVLIAFVVVVLGGLGSIPGAFAGSLIVGLIDSLTGFYVSSDMREVAVFGVFLCILILRPSGLFATRMPLAHVSP